MASSVHIFRSGPWHPLTRYEDMEFIINTPPRKLYRCHECNDLRQARSLEISVDYDRIRIRCKDDVHPGWI